MAKASLKSYFEPTPKLFRKVGLMIASAGNTFGVSSGVVGYLDSDPAQAKTKMAVGIVCCALGWIGKEITNFFEETPDDQQP